MNLFKNQRRSIRLNGYDYAQSGAYFVTICVQDKKRLFGKIINNRMVLSELGKIIKQNWNAIPQVFPQVRLDMFVIMPNHIHGIIIFNIPDDVGAQFIVSKVGVEFIQPESPGFDKSNPYIRNNPMKTERIQLGKIIRYFKAKTAYLIRHNKNTSDYSWQRNYYEHIIRAGEFDHIREYILLNPELWQYDRENDQRLKEGQVSKKWEKFETNIFG